MVKQRLGRKVRFREWGRDRVERDKNKELSGNQVMKGLLCYIKELEPFAEDDRIPLE